MEGLTVRGISILVTVLFLYFSVNPFSYVFILIIGKREIINLDLVKKIN